MREKGWEERGLKAHSKNSDFGTPLISVLLSGLSTCTVNLFSQGHQPGKAQEKRAQVNQQDPMEHVFSQSCCNKLCTTSRQTQEITAGHHTHKI